MKPKYIAVVAALAAIVVQSALAGSLPEIMTPGELRALRAGQIARAAAAQADVAKSETPTLYTGKISDADSGGYLFKYRNYNPELNRWTSVDPSGFPDWANNIVYVKNSPIFAIDYMGLTTLAIGISLEWGVGVYFNLTGQIAASFSGARLHSWGVTGTVTHGAVTGITLSGGAIATYSANEWIEQTSGAAGSFGANIQVTPFATLGYNLGNVTSGDYREWTHSVSGNFGGTFGLPSIPGTAEAGISYTWVHETPVILNLWALFIE